MRGRNASPILKRGIALSDVLFVPFMIQYLSLYIQDIRQETRSNHHKDKPNTVTPFKYIYIKQNFVEGRKYK